MSVRAHGLTASDEKLTEVRCSYAPVADGVPKLRNLEQIPSTSFDASPVSSSSSICVRPFGLNFSSFNSSLSSSESSDVVSKPAPKRKAIESQADVPFKKRKENLKIYPSSIDDDNNNNNDENGENVGDKDRRDLEVTTEPTALLGMTSKEKTQSDVGNDEFSMEIDAFRYALAESESPDDVDGKSGKGDDSTATSETKESADDVTPSTLISLGTGPGETDDEEAASRDIMDLDLDVFVDVCEVVAQMVVNVEGQDADDDGQDTYDVKGDQENDGDSEENDDENDDGSEDDDDEPASLEEAERLRQVSYYFLLLFTELLTSFDQKVCA